MTIIQKFEPEVPQSNFPKKYISITGICILVLILIEIWVSNSVVTYGSKLERLSAISKSLNLENQVLENEIAKRGSLNNVASKSAELGFSVASDIQYIR